MNYKKGTQTRGCMKSVMRYVSQLSKTLWDGQQLVSGIDCQPETAFDEFLSTKLLHHKDGGVMFYHMVQSFPKGADIDPCAAHEAARRLAGYFEGCEVLVCTHTDREHIHSHCIINSVNFETGKKVHIADKQIQELRVCNDQICEELGLPKFQRDEQKHSRGMSNAEYYTALKGESWKFELMRVIDECMRCAGSREEFLILLRSEGYDATWTDSRKNITYVRQQMQNGTGGAVMYARQFVGNDPFVVIYGDDVIIGDDPCTAQCCRAYEKYGKAVVSMKEVPFELVLKYCTLDVKPLEDNLYSISDMIEKPKPEEVISNFAILGRCVLPAKIFDILETLPTGAGGEYQLTDAMKQLAKSEGMVGVDFTGTRYDMGNKLGIMKACVEVALKHPEIGEDFRAYLKTLDI